MRHLQISVDEKEIARQFKRLPEFSTVTTNQRLFLIAYIKCGSVFNAAKNAGLGEAIHYHWMWKTDYQKAFEKAQDMYADFAEGDVMDRAFHGIEHTIVKGNGDIVEKYRKKSDILAMFALKKMRPAYRDNPQLAVNVNNAPPAITFNVLSIEQQPGIAGATTNRQSSDNELIDMKQITNTANDNK